MRTPGNVMTTNLGGKLGHALAHRCAAHVTTELPADIGWVQPETKLRKVDVRPQRFLRLRHVNGLAVGSVGRAPFTDSRQQ